MIARYYVDAGGAYLGAFVGAMPPPGAIEVPIAPPDAYQRWMNGAWMPDYPADVLNSVVDQLRDTALAALAWNGHLVATRGEPLQLLIGRAAAYIGGLREAEFLAMAATLDAGLDAAYGKAFALKAQIAAGTLTTPSAIEAAWAEYAVE